MERSLAIAAHNRSLEITSDVELKKRSDFTMRNQIPVLRDRI